MSLESQIADLVSATNGLIAAFNAKKSGIDAAVAAAIAAIPVGKRTFYVHQLNGLDTNDGSVGAPLKTIDKALSNTLYGGICEVFLQADYNLIADISGLEGRALTLRSDDAANKKFVRPAYLLTGGGATQQLASFPVFAGAMVNFRDIKILLPTATGVAPTPAGISNCLVRSITTSSSAMLLLKMTDVEVTEAAGATASLVGAGAAATVFEPVGSTFPSGFGGRYLLGVVSGTNPNTLGNVMTNLSAL